MMKPIETIQDLIEEAKVRTVWWALCIFCVTYFLSHSSSSMWMNLPISIVFVSLLRILSNEVELRWKDRPLIRRQTYLSHLRKKQLSVKDSRLSAAPSVSPPRWKRKIDSPIVEASVSKFIDKILKDFVVDLWYSEITPDREAPELMHSVIMDAIGEISGRIKEINLVDLLTRDIVDLIGDHLDLFRKSQAIIGVDVMGTLSIRERDERLRHHLMASKCLHPALISSESECKVLRQLISGVLAVVLKPREAQSPLVRTIARELITCLVMQPLMNLASPGYINELIEYILLSMKDDGSKVVDSDRDQFGSIVLNDDPKLRIDTLDRRNCQWPDLTVAKTEWANMLEAAAQRRTEVLTPENLENLWTKGRHYKDKDMKKVKRGVRQRTAGVSAAPHHLSPDHLGSGMLTSRAIVPTRSKDNAVIETPLLANDQLFCIEQEKGQQWSHTEELHGPGELEQAGCFSLNESGSGLKRSNSSSPYGKPFKRKILAGEGGAPIISEFYSPNFGRHGDVCSEKAAISEMVLCDDATGGINLKCRVVGAYFEKLGSKSFAVYSIAVTNVESRTWFVKRRYRNFEKLHRHLKDIPNYTLHLPPKRIFSSSTDDTFVHQRCIQLNKYLQELLSITNVSEQHEVWDFLSVTSKNYSFGKPSSVMRTLAVNVDDAVDDIMRQFRGVSDGLMRKVVGSTLHNGSMSFTNSSCCLPWHPNEIEKPISRHDSLEPVSSFSDNDGDNVRSMHAQQGVGAGEPTVCWHSDNELDSKGFPPRILKYNRGSVILNLEKHDLEVNSTINNQGNLLTENSTITSTDMDDPILMPLEWSPPNVTVPLLNLVDKVFLLKRRGWLRRQVFWISKQILQLVMEDAIDDWLLRQIYWLRKEETVAHCVQWVQDVLWPDGVFFTRIGLMQGNGGDGQPNLMSFGSSKDSKQASFEEQLEAARRASDIKKMLLEGAPAALVSLIGQKQYKRCTRDIFYFTQSSICVKQLAYGGLELLAVTVFPELRDLLLSFHDFNPSAATV